MMYQISTSRVAGLMTAFCMAFTLLSAEEQSTAVNVVDEKAVGQYRALKAADWSSVDCNHRVAAVAAVSNTDKALITGIVGLYVQAYMQTSISPFTALHTLDVVVVTYLLQHRKFGLYDDVMAAVQATRYGPKIMQILNLL